ncbi:hypothetical protein L873DRAFT_1668561, partial [Choiromyces venosus 120613-1]
PTLLVLNLFSVQKTEEVWNTFFANNITISLIPGSCMSLVQPLYISIHHSFKDILKVVTYKAISDFKKKKKNLIHKQEVYYKPDMVCNGFT